MTQETTISNPISGYLAVAEDILTIKTNFLDTPGLNMGQFLYLYGFQESGIPKSLGKFSLMTTFFGQTHSTRYILFHQ